MEAFSTDDIFKAVHQNHINAGNRIVLQIPGAKTEADPEVPAEALIQEDKRPRIHWYVVGTAVRFLLALAFLAFTQQELIHPKLGAVLCMGTALWAVCYWAKERWQL